MPANPTKVLLTVEEAAEQLTIGRTTLYGLIRTGAITSVRIGKLRRLRPADLATYTTRLSD
ncbi:putative excisionase (fragment) [Parafrankia sp. Ea1.12]|uniref:helix-turn-helix domain-containing protein n=1 Tax=Parafrankia sp. Ea1.12 TaxID=573499 RepID=UPI000DA53746